MRDRFKRSRVQAVFDWETGGINQVVFLVPEDNDLRLFYRMNVEQLVEQTCDDASLIPEASVLLQEWLPKLHASSEELNEILQSLPVKLLENLDAHCGRAWRALVLETVVDAVLKLPPKVSIESWASGSQKPSPRRLPMRVDRALQFIDQVDLEQHWKSVEYEIDQRVQEVLAIRGEIGPTGNVGNSKLPYCAPSLYARDKWIYENIECNSYPGLQRKLKEVPKSKRFDQITSRPGFKKAADRYATFHSLPIRRFGKAKNGSS